jgi:DNA-binding transcriptional ArsR family regulator
MPWPRRQTRRSVPTRFDAERALEASGLPQTSRDIGFALCRRMDAGTTTIPARHSPSLTELARVVGVSRRTIMRHLNLLAAAGWITRTRPPRGQAAAHATTSYTVTVPAATTSSISDQPARESGPPPAELDQIVNLIRKRTGRTITTEWAARIHRELLDRPGIRRPGAWIRTVIENEPDPSRWLPTNQPPPFKQLGREIA